VRLITRLKFERTSRKITQQTVETVSGVPQPIISLVETGRLIPTTEHRRQLAAVFGVAPDDLLKEVVVMEAAR
jgi:transcriptional regulator with XRE-family HTH domain